VSRAVIKRLVLQQRVQAPLQMLFTAAWGYLLVALFATSDKFGAMLAQQAQMLGGAWALVGLDPLRQWMAVGLLDPPFFLGGGAFAIAIGLRCVAGELQDGSLQLALTRPISRRSWFLSHLAVMIPGSFLIAAFYAVGCVAAAAATSPIGSLDVGYTVLASLEAGLLFTTFGAFALLFSSFATERGRAMAWTLGVLVVMYMLSFLLPLWGTGEQLAKGTPFGWYRPAPILQTGVVPWGDVLALALFAAVPLAVAGWRFTHRDL
jgi:ABC-type transport system involved in multi-copper enzyme maturation permease subunit